MAHEDNKFIFIFIKIQKLTVLMKTGSLQFLPHASMQLSFKLFKNNFSSLVKFTARSWLDP